MTIEEKKIKVALKVGIADRYLIQKEGWFYKQNSCGYVQLPQDAGVFSKQEAELEVKGCSEIRIVKATLPNWPGSLDAMAELECLLTERQQVWYLQRLNQVRLRQGIGGMIACMIDKLAFATAAQRFHAFGLTMGLWKEGE